MPYLLNKKLNLFIIIALIKLTLKEPLFWTETAKDVAVFFLRNTQ